MQLYTVATLMALATAAFAQKETGKLGDAAQISGNPTDVTYVAHLDNKNGTGIWAHFEFKAGPGGIGAAVEAHIKGLPAGKGEFAYHIHDQPVPSDGNCTGTKAHLDPYQRGQATPCDPKSPETCEVGDLAGKHGKIPINATVIQTGYTDAYLSLKSPSGAFIGNRSIVIHAKDSSRIACVNITLKGAHGEHSPSQGTNQTVSVPTPGSGSSPAASPAPAPGSAPGRVGVSAFLGLVVAGIGAVTLL